jgi:hypothetical protein
MTVILQHHSIVLANPGYLISLFGEAVLELSSFVTKRLIVFAAGKPKYGNFEIVSGFTQVRVEAQRKAKFVEGVVYVAGTIEGVAQIVAGLRIERVQIDCLSKLGNGRLRFATGIKGAANGNMTGCRVRVKKKSFARRASRCLCIAR